MTRKVRTAPVHPERFNERVQRLHSFTGERPIPFLVASAAELALRAYYGSRRGIAWALLRAWTRDRWIGVRLTPLHAWTSWALWRGWLVRGEYFLHVPGCPFVDEAAHSSEELAEDTCAEDREPPWLRRLAGLEDYE